MKTWRTKLGGVEFQVRRMQECPNDAAITENPEQTVSYLLAMLPTSVRWNTDTENFGIVFLTARRKPIGFEIISNGTLDTLLVHARQVFKPAIVMNAAAIILFHNHPSGDPSPSEADIKVTRDLIKGGSLLGIPVIDHLILGQSTPARPQGYASLRELGYFNS